VPTAAAVPSLSRLRSLEAVVRWALAQEPPLPIDVHPMDEFTHDVVVQVEDAVWTVFDST
jgi:hypothetical protein